MVLESKRNEKKGQIIPTPLLKILNVEWACKCTPNNSIHGITNRYKSMHILEIIYISTIRNTVKPCVRTATNISH